MERVCFRLQVRPDRIEEYAARHAQVWPEMLRALEATEVNARSQNEMAEFFEDLGSAGPDTGFTRLEEVFHLEDQLGRSSGARTFENGKT